MLLSTPSPVSCDRRDRPDDSEGDGDPPSHPLRAGNRADDSRSKEGL